MDENDAHCWGWETEIASRLQTESFHPELSNVFAQVECFGLNVSASELIKLTVWVVSKTCRNHDLKFFFSLITILEKLLLVLRSEAKQLFTASSAAAMFYYYTHEFLVYDTFIFTRCNVSLMILISLSSLKSRHIEWKQLSCVRWNWFQHPQARKSWGFCKWKIRAQHKSQTLVDNAKLSFAWKEERFKWLLWIWIGFDFNL